MNRAQAADYCGYEYISDYMAAGAIKMDDTNAKVVNFYGTDEWKNMLNELVGLNEKGLLDGECGYMDEYGESQRVAKRCLHFILEPINREWRQKNQPEQDMTVSWQLRLRTPIFPPTV